LVVGSKVDYL